MAQTRDALGTVRRRVSAQAEREPRAFISYRRRPPSDAIAERLDEFLSRHGLDVWRDTQRIAPGDAWRADIAEAIDRADAVVALISRDVSDSHEVRSELEYARRQRKPIIPVFVEPVDTIDRATLLVVGGLDWIDSYRDVDAGFRRLLGALASIDTTEGAHYTTRTRFAVLSRMQPSEISELMDELHGRLSTGVEDVEGHLALGLCLLHRGQWRAAHRHFVKARGLDPTEARAPYFVGLALTQGRRPRALRSVVFNEVDQLLTDAQAAGPTSGIYPYARALFRRDFYANNGMLVPVPDVDVLMRQAHMHGVSDDEINRLHHLVPDLEPWS